MSQNLMGTNTTLIDKTSNTNYIYIGVATIYANVSPEINEDKWQISRITLSNGAATEIKNAHADNTIYFKWSDRLTLNYI